MRRLGFCAAGLAASACIAWASTTAYTTGTVSSLSVTGPVSLRLDVPAVVAGGQPLPLRLVLTNLGKVTVMIGVPDQKFFRTDFMVMHGSRQVWHKLRHRSCGCAVQEGPLSPNDSLVFQESWPQRSDHHWPVSPGRL
jgi:hypothetical protein